jgi:hypothetical protein
MNKQETIETPEPTLAPMETTFAPIQEETQEPMELPPMESVYVTKSLVDEKGERIRECNIELHGKKYHVLNSQEFQDVKTKASLNFNLCISMCFVTMLFLCIFTLNFSSNAWSLGNLVTCFIMLFTCFLTVISLKEWNIQQLTLNKFITDGSPCKKTDKDSTSVYCS